MAQVEKVSWRTVSYSALGAAALIAGTVGLVRSDGVRPTSLKSNASTRWLVDQTNHRLVLADGLTGRVLARIKTESESDTQVAFQGAAGSFLASPEDGTVRAISTAKLQLAATQRIPALSDDSDPDAVEFGVGTNGLTVVNTATDQATLVSANDPPRPITVPHADKAFVARDGSMWLFAGSKATHVTVDGSTQSYDVVGQRGPTATIGTHAVYLDRQSGVIHWLDGGAVPVSSIPNFADAILQVPRGDDASCLWMAANDLLACVGKTSIETTIPVRGLTINPSDVLAVADSVAVVINSATNEFQRIDLSSGKFLETDVELPPAGDQLRTVSINGMVWIDDTEGDLAWVVHRFGVYVIDKTDDNAPLLNAQGQVDQEGDGGGGEVPGAGGSPGTQDESDHLDDNDREDPPVAVDDSVTARAGNTVTIPVTANDYDPEGQAIALASVGDGRPAGHGTVDVLDGASVAYVPEVGYSGSDSFDYTIVDEKGNSATGTVSVELFAPDSPNRPPITQADHVKTRAGHAVTIDVLSNDIDPERELLSIFTFAQRDGGTIEETVGPTGLPALEYTPPSDTARVYTFTYQAADTEGGISDDTEVTVEVLRDNAPNQPPVARPDAIRLRVGASGKLNVRANDSDADGDDLTIESVIEAPGVTADITGGQLNITMHPSAKDTSVVRYVLTDGTLTAEGRVLVLKIADDAPNRPPVANPDTERVVIGKSVRVAVTANDIDPERDLITLIGADDPEDGSGTVAVEGNFVRFTPSLSDIDEPTPVTFTYRIADGHGNTAVGHVTVTVLAEALPRNPLAIDDLVETEEGKPITVDVLANDIDPNGGRPNLLGKPVCLNGGDASATGDQKVTFTPPVGQGPGIYRCEYRVVGSQGQDTAMIIVTVTPAEAGNHLPVINDANTTAIVAFGGQFTFNANTVAADADGDALQFASVDRPSLGSTNYSQKSTTFTFIAPSSASSESPLSVNFNVSITDNRGTPVTTQLSIQLVDTTTSGSTPIVAPQIQRSVEIDKQTSVDVPAELADENPGMTLTLVSASGNSSQAEVTSNLNTGVVLITPHVTGDVSVSYTVRNAALATATGTIVVTVTPKPPENAPPVAVDDSLTVSSGGTGVVDVLANDTGISDPDDDPSATMVLAPPASFGTVKIEAGRLTLKANPNYGGGKFTATYNVSDGSGRIDTGAVFLEIEACTASAPAAQTANTFTPYMTPINIDLNPLVISGTFVPGSIHGANLTGPTGTYTPPAGKNDAEVVTFDVSNACGQVAHGSLTIDVNRAPTAHSASKDVSPGQTVNVLPAEIADDDEALSITALQGQPAWVTLAGDGSAIIATPPVGTPSAGYTFTATVSDPGGLSTTATITLNVSNTPPTAVDDAYTTGDALLTVSPLVNDSDVEPGPLSIQTVSVVDGPAQVLGWTDTTVMLNVGHGVSHFTYTIHDSGGLTDSAAITVTSNHDPTAPNVSATTDQPSVLIDFSPEDPDNDPLNISCTAPPGWTVDPLDNPSPPPEVWLYVTMPPDAVTSSFPCRVTDPYGGSATAIVTVTIT